MIYKLFSNDPTLKCGAIQMKSLRDWKEDEYCANLFFASICYLRFPLQRKEKKQNIYPEIQSFRKLTLGMVKLDLSLNQIDLNFR